ncbi:MAG: hypothetical protein ACKO6N_03160 [Myxococcota bacterium]
MAAVKSGCWALLWLLSPAWALSAEPLPAEDFSSQQRVDPVVLEAERVEVSLETGALEAHDAHLRMRQPALALYAGHLWRLPSGEWRAERLELQPCGCEGREGWPLRVWASRGVLELDPLTQEPAFLRLRGPRLLLGRSSFPAQDVSKSWSLPLPPLNIPLDPVLYEELSRVKLWHEQAGWSVELPLWRGGGGPLWGHRGVYQLGGGWRAGLGPQLGLRVETQRLGHRLEGTLEGLLDLEGASQADTQAGTQADTQTGTLAPRGILRAQLLPQPEKGSKIPAVQVNAQVEAVTDGEILTRLWREPLDARRTWLASGLMVGVPWASGRAWLQLTHDTELTTGAGSTTVGSFPWWGLEQALPKVGWGDTLWGLGGGGLVRLEGWQDLLLPGWTGGLNTLLPTPTHGGGLVETRLSGQVGLGAVGLEPWGRVQGAGERAESGEAGAVVRGIWGMEARLPLARTYTHEGVKRLHRIIPVLGMAQAETWSTGTLPSGGRLALGEGFETGMWGILRQELQREGNLLSVRRTWLETGLLSPGLLSPGGIPRLAEGFNSGWQLDEWAEAMRGWLRFGMDWGEGMQLEGGAQLNSDGVEGSWWDVGWKVGEISGGITGWQSVGEGLFLSPWRKIPTEAGLGGGMWLKVGLERWLRGLEVQGRVEGLGATARVERASLSWRDACGCVKLELFVEGGRLGMSAGR